jgi:hypothetical protein
MIGTSDGRSTPQRARLTHSAVITVVTVIVISVALHAAALARTGDNECCAHFHEQQRLPTEGSVLLFRVRPCATAARTAALPHVIAMPLAGEFRFIDAPNEVLLQIPLKTARAEASQLDVLGESLA